MKKVFFIVSALLFVFACTKNEDKLFIKKYASQTGITFKNQLLPSTELNILTYLYYYNGAGIAAADFNNDTLIDLYFTSNQGADKLYINKGNFKFEEVTDQANISNPGNWTTGVTHTDINNDGLLDIYICKVGNYKNSKGHNLLLVNQGVNDLGIPVFKEAAAEYGLDFSGFSTQASFFDYDLDGDLDMYLLNHSVHPNRNYGNGNLRNTIDSLSGDRLYKNEEGKYVDVSNAAGIFQGKIGYGLGLGISDVNNDGYPDIYVGNDFFENDYLYINQKNGSFKEIISEDDRKLGHTSHFSMGNDLADINNDGLIDIVSLDMLPENLKTYKTSGLEFPYPSYQYYLKNGYAPQYMQNTLHLNLGDNNFGEVAHSSGIAATEWSWAPLLADYDNDGFKDLFVSNGIKGATNDMDYINFIANENLQRRIDKGMSTEDLSFIKEIPEKKIANYFFKNNGNLRFSNVTEMWMGKETSFSNGAVYADLDNDGDLDIVVNNVNQEAFVFENTSIAKTQNKYLKIDFKGNKTNRFGIGTRVIAYSNGKTICQENFSSRGYLSAVPPTMHIGVRKDSIIDSLKVLWPTGKYQMLTSIPSNQRITVEIKNASKSYVGKKEEKHVSFLKNVSGLLNFKHKDQSTIEFNRDPLVPYANTNEGPDISVADINNDGLDDIFIGGAKGQPSQLFSQDTLGNFSSIQKKLFSKDSKAEATSHIFFDADNDKDQDLIVVHGGNEFTNGTPLEPILYKNNNGVFQKDQNNLPGLEINASKVAAIDYDNDGDLDLTISSDLVPQAFGKTPRQYLFNNDGNGNFTDATATISKDFVTIGNVKDFTWVDIDNNGLKDLIVVGHWMPISVFLNKGGYLELQKDNGLSKTHGWWNTIEAADFDNDGDIDFIVGNWGLNSMLKASKEKPITLYRQDFDDNGSIEPLVTYFHKDIETPFVSKDELVKQMPFLNKKYLSYAKFANASLQELFSEKKLKQSQQKKVYELRSLYFKNDGNNSFSSTPLPAILQTSVIQDIVVDDLTNDGLLDVLVVGNFHEISTQLGRMDGFHGILLKNNPNGSFDWLSNQNFDISGAARKIEKIKNKNLEYYIVGINNDAPVLLLKNKE